MHVVSLVSYYFLTLFFAITHAADPPIFISHGDEGETCKDADAKCPNWANDGECQTNAAWMMAHCRRSCQSCQGGDRAWKLRKFLSTNYDNTTIHGKRNFTVHDVTVQSLHVDHLEVDEKYQTAKVHGRMVMTWLDKRLMWDKTKWDLSWLNFYWIQIWMPQLVQQNSLKGIDEPSIKWKTIAANYTGQVYMWADFVLNAPCDFDYSMYPRDTQSCCFKIDDKRYFVVKFNVANHAKETARDSVGTTHAAGWGVSSIDVNVNKYRIPVLKDWRRDPLDLESTNFDLCLTFKRLTTYHSAEIVGPCVATALVTLTSFLSKRLDYQIWMLIASIGLQILALQTLDVKLPPPTADVPNIVQFYNLNLALTCVILIILSLLLCLSAAQTLLPPPHKLDVLLDHVSRCFRCMPREEKGPVDAEGNPMKMENPWAKFAYTVRCLLFIVFLVVYALAMISCLRS